MQKYCLDYKALNFISFFLTKNEKYSIGLSAINLSIKQNSSIATNFMAYKLRSRIQRNLAVLEKYRKVYLGFYRNFYEKVNFRDNTVEFSRLCEAAVSDLEQIKLSGLTEWTRVRKNYSLH